MLCVDSGGQCADKTSALFHKRSTPQAAASIHRQMMIQLSCDIKLQQSLTAAKASDNAKGLTRDPNGQCQCQSFEDTPQHQFGSMVPHGCIHHDCTSWFACMSSSMLQGILCTESDVWYFRMQLTACANFTVWLPDRGLKILPALQLCTKQAHMPGPCC